MKNIKKLLILPLVASFFITFSSMDVYGKSSSSGSASGFKSGSFSNSKSSSSTSSTTTTSKSTKTVDTNSSALRRIPSTYSSHSVSNNYYYNTSNGGSSFWSNYWMYRALTPEHRTYVIDSGSTVVAPSYTGTRSILPDLITLIVLIAIICGVVYIIKKRRN